MSMNEGAYPIPRIDDLPGIKTRTYEKMKFELQQKIAGEQFMDAHIDFYIDEIMNRMVLSMRHSVWAYHDKVEDECVKQTERKGETEIKFFERKWPVTWWDRAKEDFQKWALLSRFPFLAKLIRTVNTMDVIAETHNHHYHVTEHWHKHYHVYPNADLRSAHNTVKVAEFTAREGRVQ